jgi:selenocysteine lyase/cysteine desulfurase
MIKEVSFEKTTYNELPFKFEAGTPNIGDVIAVKIAIDFINEKGKQAMRQHEDNLLMYATEKLRMIEGLKIIGDVSTIEEGEAAAPGAAAGAVDAAEDVQRDFATREQQGDVSVAVVCV